MALAQALLNDPWYSVLERLALDLTVRPSLVCVVRS